MPTTTQQSTTVATAHRPSRPTSRRPTQDQPQRDRLTHTNHPSEPQPQPLLTHRTHSPTQAKPTPPNPTNHNALTQTAKPSGHRHVPWPNKSAAVQSNNHDAAPCPTPARRDNPSLTGEFSGRCRHMAWPDAPVAAQATNHDAASCLTSTRRDKPSRAAESCCGRQVLRSVESATVRAGGRDPGPRPTLGGRGDLTRATESSHRRHLLCSAGFGIVRAGDRDNLTHITTCPASRTLTGAAPGRGNSGRSHRPRVSWSDGVSAIGRGGGWRC
jgi:hypothetical protein